jgi:hypothetical protein
MFQPVLDHPAVLAAVGFLRLIADFDLARASAAPLVQGSGLRHSLLIGVNIDVFLVCAVAGLTLDIARFEKHIDSHEHSLKIVAEESSRRTFLPRHQPQAVETTTRPFRQKNGKSPTVLLPIVVDLNSFASKSEAREAHKPTRLISVPPLHHGPKLAQCWCCA